MAPLLSIIIPTLNEAAQLEKLWASLGALRQREVQIILADGGSSDGTTEQLPTWVELVRASRGRARQMNAGAARATGKWLLFLHADTRLPTDMDSWLPVIEQASDSEWGFFSVRLSGHGRLLRMVEGAMSWRSRLTHVATGDQAIFIRRELFNSLGGYPDMPLMEDVELTTRLRKRTKPLVISEPVLTSSRRWEERGVLQTVLAMWSLRLAYACGVSPARLVKFYYPSAKTAGSHVGGS